MSALCNIGVASLAQGSYTAEGACLRRDWAANRWFSVRNQQGSSERIGEGSSRTVLGHFPHSQRPSVRTRLPSPAPLAWEVPCGVCVGSISPAKCRGLTDEGIPNGSLVNPAMSACRSFCPFCTDPPRFPTPPPAYRRIAFHWILHRAIELRGGHEALTGHIERIGAFGKATCRLLWFLFQGSRGLPNLFSHLSRTKITLFDL